MNAVRLNSNTNVRMGEKFFELIFFFSSVGQLSNVQLDRFTKNVRINAFAAVPTSNRRHRAKQNASMDVAVQMVKHSTITMNAFRSICVLAPIKD